MLTRLDFLRRAATAASRARTFSATAAQRNHDEEVDTRPAFSMAAKPDSGAQKHAEWERVRAEKNQQILKEYAEVTNVPSTDPVAYKAAQTRARDLVLQSANLFGEQYVAKAKEHDSNAQKACGNEVGLFPPAKATGQTPA